MRILQVNIFGNLSTGRIATDLYRTLVANGEEGCVAFARNMIPDDVPHIIIGNSTDVKVHGLMTRITDKTGFYSKRATRKFIQRIEEYKPDVIHLHNIHGYYINIELLFNYLKETQIPVAGRFMIAGLSQDIAVTIAWQTVIVGRQDATTARKRRLTRRVC